MKEKLTANMRRFGGIVLVVGITMFGSAAFAQEISDSHLAAAREAVAASQSTISLDVILPNMGEQVKQALITNRPDAADQISDIVNEITVQLAPRRGDLETEMAKIYASVFSEDELKTITEFYQTEAGRKLVLSTAVIGRDMDQAARVWATGVRRDLEIEVQKKIVEAGLN
jgi:uncharacterized protein